MVNGYILLYSRWNSVTQLASLVQGGMICGEIIFGGMLIIGLFTPVAAIATIAMGCMIWASGMAPTEMLWYLVGGFALIGNSGMVSRIRLLRLALVT